MKRPVRFGAGALDRLGELSAELGIERPVLVTTRRGARAAAARVEVTAVFDGVRPHVPVETVGAAVEAAAGAGGIVALGGGSAIDTAKAVSAGTGLPVIAVPTTYAGAEWTPFFGMRDEARRRKGGGSGARVVGAVYDPELTLDLPLPETVGTAMNALAHCAEALYVDPPAERHAFTGARALTYALPLVVEQPRALYPRTRLLEGAMRAAMALGDSGLALAHALAQALGGRYGLPHGALNAICLAPALRFNRDAAPGAIRALGEAMGTDEPIRRIEELARLGGFESLRDLGVPEEELDEVAAEAAARPGTRANPRPASAAQIAALYRSVY